MHLTERNLSVVVCTPCTLNCRLCCASQPLLRKEGISYYHDANIFERELDEAFQIYNYVEKLTFTGGGEPLLHKQLHDMVGYALKKYPSQFDRLRIVTNGTLLPSEALIKIIKTYMNNNVEFLIDDYGAVSKKVTDITELLKANNIPFVVYRYYGEDQHYNGWVDLGPMDQLRDYSFEEASDMIRRCHLANWKCVYIFDGKLFLCIRSVTAFATKLFELDPHEYIDLIGQTQTLDKKRNIAKSFGSQPIRPCYYCDGWDAENSVRFPGGEQAK